jgi:hypothetical protein
MTHPRPRLECGIQLTRPTLSQEKKKCNQYKTILVEGIRVETEAKMSEDAINDDCN